MEDSADYLQDMRQRGRPRKPMQPFRFGPYVYRTPLGFQYTQPRILATTLQAPIYARAPDPPPAKREKRAAAIKAMPQRRRRYSSEESDSSVGSESETLQEVDPHEKLLDYNEEEDKFLVKFRGLSYIHCDWVSASEIKASRTGLMKTKRFKKVGIDPAYTKVDRVLTEAVEDSERLVLIKWRKLPYDLATFELYGDAEKCDGFGEALQEYRDRKKIRQMRMSLGWRPAREQQVKYEESPVYKNGNKLKSFQLEGLNWLLNRWYFRQGCIMADEMGLGKTVQSVSFVNALFTQFEYTAPVIIVVVLGTIPHWQSEFKNWTNLRVLTYLGSVAERSVIADYEFQVRAGNITVRLFDVILTTYEMVMAGTDHLTQFEYGVGIFDEAHRLKNPNSKAASCLRSFPIQHRVLLSGTPIQNNLNELWALFNFIDPMRFDNLQGFLEEYKMEKAEDVERLQALLKPLMLRRMKDDVETSIPMKEETVIEVELTMTQKRYYRAILEKNLEFLARDDKANAPNLINAMMELRKCCIHPYLLNGAEEKIVSDFARKNPEIASTDQSAVASRDPLLFGSYWFSNSDEYYNLLIHSSGKLVLLDKLLQKLHGQHKVLIFSQMTRCLDLLSDYLNYRKYTYERIDGSIRGDLRQAAIDRFSSGEAFVFLLCTKAGGVGINLTAADTVVIFDSDWNPQNDLQAQARCHRIGQKNEVKIYRLITRNSYEREMLDKAGKKLGLDQAILQRMNHDRKDGETPVRKEDAIQLLLRKGAYGVLMDTDDASQKFCEEDIDQILERRTRVVRHSDGGGGNVFSKASFQLEEVGDPDFWNNLLSQKKSEENEGCVKRQCRRLSREGVLSAEDRDHLSAKLRKVLGSEDVKQITELDPENQHFAIFLLVLLKGHSSLQVNLRDDVLGGNKVEGASPEAHRLSQLASLVKYCMDLICNEKLKNDFLVHMEKFQIEYDPNLFIKHADEYMKYHVQFLFRMQVPMIFMSLESTDDLVSERVRGWSAEEDKGVIGNVINVGYDCVDYKGKTREEVNIRVRKMLAAMYHRREVKENDNMYFKTILNFGRLTDRNELSVERFLKKDATKLRSIVERICSMTRRARRDTPEADCFDRIVFFDRLEAIEVMPTVRRIGMPKKWDKLKDEELREHLLTEGFVGVFEKFSVQEDQVIRRFEMIFKVCNVPAKE